MSQQFPSQQRRGLSPISTAFSSASNRPSTSSSSPSRSTFLPTSATSNSVPAASSRQNLSRNSSVSSTSSPFSPSQGAQQPQSGQLLSSARSRNISSNNSQLASSAAGLPSASQGGVAANSGGGGPKLARASPSLSTSSGIGSPVTNNPTSAPLQPQQSLSKIVVAQVFLLLSTINQEKDKAKRESQAENITSLVGQYGMDVFSKYFRRLLQNNAAQIFSGTPRPADPTGSYQLLVNEVQKIRHDPKQAQQIAESLDTPEGEIFRDFDVSTFMEHFQLDAVAKTMLALELKTASKSDLRTKADAILTNNFQNLLKAIMNPTSETGDDLPLSYLCGLLDRLIQDPPRNWNEEHKMSLQYAIAQRYEKIPAAVPGEILSTLHLSELLGPTNPLVRLVQRAGPRATSSLDLCRDMLASAETRDINYTQVASVLLFMVISHNGQAYNPANFVTALREHRSGKRLDWQDVVHGFDREGLSITKAQFLALYSALLPLAQEYENFDIQLLWGGQWTQPETQLSFVVAFLSCSPEEIDASTIPRLRKTFSIEDFEDASDEIKARAADAAKHPLVSYDAVKALFTMIFRSQEDYKHATMLGIPDTVINPHTDYFVLSTAAVPQPWGPIQEQAFKQLWMPFLKKRLPGYSFVFHGLWKRDNNWLASKFMEAYNFNPLDVQFIFEHAQEHGWLEMLTTLNVPMSLDLAAYAHGRDSWDIEAWLQQTYQALPDIFPRAVHAFLEERAGLDQQLLRNPEALPTTVPLTVKTVFAFLNFLQELIPDDNVIPLLRHCIAAYPRIVNYGEGFDEIIDANGKNGNALAPEADAQMQEHFKKLYNKESDVREIVEALRRYRQSEEPAKQELFSCMIAGLFDEYHCFSEYPPEALATTAVLFGSIINFGILSNISLRAAMAMVLEAVHADSDSNMFKFGVEALLHFKGRLSEWPRFCQELLQLRGLQPTEIWPIATDVVRKSMKAGVDSAAGEQNGDGDAANHHGLANGDGEKFMAGESTHPQFTCLEVDPPLRSELYEDPDEEVQDRVLFILNNVSERNLSDKLRDLQETLEDKHHQWFAAYLVEERAKLQPNFQQLYLDMLKQFDDKMLWAEVLRETYVSSIRLLNSESTVSSSSERGHLKNLGSWLGALTLARNKAIRHKNISFRDLLIEAYQTSRLVSVVPFVCKVLVQAAKSKVFQPPNPWTVEILTILVELYHHADMKLNLKFEVEVLCKGLDVEFKSIQASTIIRDKMSQSIEEDYLTTISEVNDGFGDMPLGLARSRTQLSQAQIASRIPDISSRLYYPALSTPGVDIDEVNRAFASAAQSAISEIIFPVVERSVTIAAISTRELVVKDYSTEPDELKFRTAAHNLVKNLAGSLAHVTCREPLRMAMTNNIRLLSRNIANDGLPEGIILMFVNDNIDVVCKVVEENAEEQSIAEIDRRIAEDISARQSHKSGPRDEPFVYPPVSKWANCIPEPYRPTIGGLKPEQLAVYEEFSPARAISGPLQTPVAENRTAPDMANEQYPSIPNLTTPGGEPPVLRQGNQHQRLQQMQSLPGASVQAQLNGYMDSFSPQDRVIDMFSELLRGMKDALEDNIQDLGLSSPTRETFARLLAFIESMPLGPQREAVCLLLLQRVTQALYGEVDRRLEVDVLVQLLLQVSHLSSQVGKQLNMWLAQVDDERIFNPLITPSLVSANLLSIYRLDTLLESAIRERKPYALDFFDRALDELLLSRQSIALRTDLIKAIEALVNWISLDLDAQESEQARSILKRLELNTEKPPSTPATKTDEYEAILDSWIHLIGSKPSKTVIASFIFQLHTNEILKDKPAEALFFRTCVDACIAAYEDQELHPFGGDLDAAYVPVDALARLVVALVAHQGEDDGAVKSNQAGYLDSILCTLILNQMHHQQTRGERANQKVFYRLYSSILCYLADEQAALAGFFGDIMIVFGKALLALQPTIMPSFSFAWLALVAHRLFMPAMLKSTEQGPCDLYAHVMVVLLKFTGDLVKPLNVTHQARQYYLAVLRLLLVLHHDFPEFTTEYHMALTDAIPTHCTQLRNVVLSAYPSSMAELPDPFTAGLKADRIEEIRRQPVIREDIVGILKAAGVDKAVENLLASMDPNPDDFNVVCKKLSTPKAGATGLDYAPIDGDIEAIHALVLHVIMQATATAGSKDPTYNKNTPHAALLHSLVRELPSEARYYLLGAMITQLRYPNSHTHYISYAILDIFGQSSDDALAYEIQEDITRILLERLTVHRPHPWGLLVLMLQLVKNNHSQFWDLPFVKANPEVEKLYQSLYANLISGRAIS